MIDLTTVFLALIALSAAVFAAFILPLLRNKLDADKLETLCKWVKIAVAAAEQLFNVSESEKKKEYVLAFLRSKGYEMNMPEIEQAVEAAVLELHRRIYDYSGDDGEG